MASYRPIPTEHEEQVALIKWAQMQYGVYPELEGLYAVPNGAQRPTKVDKDGRKYCPEGVKLKAEGVRKGVPDLALDVSRGGYGSLKIEMKRREGGVVSDDQKWWLDWFETHGHLAVVCNGFDEAKDMIVAYLEGKCQRMT